ncbi:FAD-dependent monooxygenase [Nonomuraea typhae]|uniref:FAD-dependent monooxygenase n=1 Tax=Nonomuraea typhae TaxID=2603600 RepID=UPI0012F8E46B|nr:FAD-dependent monooxygenase [Nonomuraea typhae]
MTDEILIAGGGIGGLTTALACARSGRRVRVLERSEEFAEIGAGLQLAPNATRILDRLGVLGRVIAAGVLPERLVFNDALTGDRLTHLDLGEPFRQRYGGPYVVLHRSDLLDILVAACREHGVQLDNDRHVTGVTSRSDGVTVSCADGTGYHGALVVAADGLRSGLRALLSDDEPVCSGYVAYRGAVPIEEAGAHGALTDVVVWLGPGLHLVQYPLRGGRMYNQVAVFRSRRFAEGHADWGLPGELDEAFSVTCDRVRAAVPALWRDRRWPMSDREPIGDWVAGRTALLGDAAHPMLQYLAQGACQAIEDAAALADAVDRHLPAGHGAAGDVDKALRAYAAERIPRTARVQRTARVWGDIWHVDGLARDLRNALFSRREAGDFSDTDWLYGPGPTASKETAHA